MQDIFATLTEPVVAKGPAGPALDDYDKAVKILVYHFSYKPNTAFERHLFGKMSQRQGETVARFVRCLREQAALCVWREVGVGAPERSGYRANHADTEAA